MKTDEKIIEAVNKAKKIVQKIYADDPRLKNAKNQTPNSGVTMESNIVFREVLRHCLDN